MSMVLHLLLPISPLSFLLAPPQEMIYQEPRETLATALMSLKEAIPELSGAMQSCIRDKRNTELKVCLDGPGRSDSMQRAHGN